jgi:hypothetical protein
MNFLKIMVLEMGPKDENGDFLANGFYICYLTLIIPK